MGFKDHFSGVAEGYARFRPTYPEALFDWLAERAPGRELAWDVATGSGQVATALAERFDRVIATEPSEAQLAHAKKNAKVEYRREPAELSSLADASASLVTVGQALHWFDHEAFAAEVRRVLVPGGLFAAWCYDLLRLDDSDLDRLVDDLYKSKLAPYWPPERALVEQGYEGIPLAYPRIEAPRYTMEHAWTLDDLLGYLGTWSASQRYREATGEDPLEELAAALGSRWGDPMKPRTVRWPLTVVACVKPA